MTNAITTEDPRQCWSTPDDAWQWIDKTFGSFDLDVCADADNTKCRWYFAAPGYQGDCLGVDALKQNWTISGMPIRCWCNPPFADPWPWLMKAHTEAIERDAHTFVLLPLDTSTEWFDYFLDKAHRLHGLRPRLQFSPRGAVKSSSNPKPSVLIEFKRDAQPDGVIHICEPYKPITTIARKRLGLLETAARG